MTPKQGVENGKEEKKLANNPVLKAQEKKNEGYKRNRMLQSRV